MSMPRTRASAASSTCCWRPLLGGAAGLLWAAGQPLPVALGPLASALLVLLAHLLRRWLKVSLHAAFAVFAAALVWPHPGLTLATVVLAAGGGLVAPGFAPPHAGRGAARPAFRRGNWRRLAHRTALTAGAPALRPWRRAADNPTFKQESHGPTVVTMTSLDPHRARHAPAVNATQALTLPNNPARWWILALLFVCRTGLGLQFQTLGSVSDPLVTALGFSYVEIGTLIGLFMLPGLVLALPAGYMGRYLSDRVLVGLALACLAVGGVIASMAQGFGLLALGRIAAGAGFVISTIYLTKMTADWFAGNELATAMGILVMSWPLGIAIGQIGHVWLAVHFDWRAAFLVAVAVLRVERPGAVPAVPAAGGAEACCGRPDGPAAATSWC